MSYRARSYELVSPTEAEAIAKADAERLGAGPKFVQKNTLTYYLALNTWYNLIQDWADHAWIGVRDHVRHYGLVATVGIFTDSCPAIIAGEMPDDPLVCDVISSIAVVPRNFRVTSLGYVPSEKAVSLEICRYLKRLGLQDNDKSEETALNSFHQFQVELGERLVQADEESPLIEAVRNVLSEALPWDDICSRLGKMDATSRTFTVGAAKDAGKTLCGKLLRMAEVNPGFFRPIHGSWLCPAPSQTVDPEYTDEEYRAKIGLPFSGGHFDHAHSVRISTAPKALKGPRIIALEPVNEQTAERYAKDILYDYFPAGMDLTDQSRNQELAFEGAVSGRYATIDLSSASDCVTKWLVCRVFPEEFLRKVWWMVPSHYELKKEKYPLYSFATMGNGLTFWFESVLFWAIARAVTDQDPTVYGDDIVVRTQDAEAVINALESLGFKVNRDKTFVTGSYRESCGVEFDGSAPMTSLYYPRFPIYGEITEHTVSFGDFTHQSFKSGEVVDSTLMVVTLQHKLTNISQHAAAFVADVVRDAHPSMTTHRYGTECDDLWGPSPLLGKDGWEPYARYYFRAEDYSVFVPFFGFYPGSIPPDLYLDRDFFAGYSTLRRDAVKVLEDLQVSPRPTVYRPHIQYKAGANHNELAEGLFRHYIYAEELRRGPSYAHDLLKGLGPNPVSDPPMGLDALDTPVVVWGWGHSTDF